jgi:hypothetical protein
VTLYEKFICVLPFEDNHNASNALRASLVELGTSLPVVVRCAEQQKRHEDEIHTTHVCIYRLHSLMHFFVLCGSCDYRGSLGSNRDIVTSQRLAFSITLGLFCEAQRMHQSRAGSRKEGMDTRASVKSW